MADGCFPRAVIAVLGAWFIEKDPIVWVLLACQVLSRRLWLMIQPG